MASPEADVFLAGKLIDLLRLLQSQGWRVGRPRCLSIGGAISDQVTVAERPCERCGHGSLSYTPLANDDMPDVYRAVQWCEKCHFAEEI